MQKLISAALILLFSICSLAASAESKPLRIVSLTPSLTDTVIELDGADLLVGVLDYGSRPVEIKDVASVGKFGQFSLEKLISLKPDLILVWPTSIKPSEEQRLTNLGYTLLKTNPYSLDELSKQIKSIGEQIGRAEQGQKLAQIMQTEIAELRKKYYKEHPTKVFYQLSDKPMYTIGKNQIISDALTVCGAENIFADTNIPAPEVNIETVLSRNPQAIIASSEKLLDTWKAWSQINAVKNKQLLLYDNDHLARPSFAMLAAIKQLCQLINHNE